LRPALGIGPLESLESDLLDVVLVRIQAGPLLFRDVSLLEQSSCPVLSLLSGGLLPWIIPVPGRWSRGSETIMTKMGIVEENLDLGCDQWFILNKSKDKNCFLHLSYSVHNRDKWEEYLTGLWSFDNVIN